MNKIMELKPIFERINFADRYRQLCDENQSFSNRLTGVNRSIYESALKSIGYDFKYHSKGSFYQILDKIDDYDFMLNLVLKDGLVESLIYISTEENPLKPQGRFDFLPEDMGIDFERKRFNLPIYTTESELEEILREIFSIYEDIKKEVSKETV